MHLDSVEQDILGDMAQDSHFLWEIFHFVRAANPGSSDRQVLADGRNLVADCLARGWLVLARRASSEAEMRSLDEVLPLIDSLGIQVTYGGTNVELDLSPKAYADVEWLGRGHGLA